MPGAGSLSAEELAAASLKSCNVLRDLGPAVQWVESYVTNDRLYCIYIAANEELIRRHGEMGGFPVTRVSEVRASIDPTTAEGAGR
jgi:hypothetical protein